MVICNMYTLIQYLVRSKCFLKTSSIYRYLSLDYYVLFEMRYCSSLAMLQTAKVAIKSKARNLQLRQKFYSTVEYISLFWN